MSVWDWLIIGLFVINAALLGSIGYVAARMGARGGQLYVGRIRPLIASGKALAAAGARAAASNRAVVSGLVLQVSGLRDLMRRETLPAGMKINYGSIMGALTTLRTVRRTYDQVQKFRHRRMGPIRVIATTPPARPSIPERLGLVPPAARHIGKVVRVARMLWNVHGQLRKRGVY